VREVERARPVEVGDAQSGIDDPCRTVVVSVALQLRDRDADVGDPGARLERETAP
jgi:hypothetical protein